MKCFAVEDESEVLNNANPPGKPQPLSSPFLDDIPEAVRESADVEVKPQSSRSLLLWGGLGAMIVVVAGLWLGLRLAQAPNSASSPTQKGAAVNPGQTNNQDPAKVTNTLLGHLPYPEATPDSLEPLSVDRRIRLRKPAAQAFEKMVAAAQAEGINLVPISGFRSASEQQHLFFDIKAERGQALQKRAEVSAPPGYSEHHTGYAVDVGDWNNPATDLSPAFEKTAAFQWLAQNAARFNFEISFPAGNAQGVSYEPWHWRFVGDRDSLETFYKARQGTASPSPSAQPLNQ